MSILLDLTSIIPHQFTRSIINFFPRPVWQQFNHYNIIFLNNPQPKATYSKKVDRPENAGKGWTTEEEQQLIKMYNNGYSKKEMCDTFKRTEVALAARLVRLGIIENRDVFRGRK